MIYRFIITIFTLIILNPCQAAQTGRVEYDGVLMDYGKLNVQALKKEADTYFNRALSTESKKDYEIAAGKYYLLTKIDSENIAPFIQLARVYDYLSKPRLAKEYFFKATNLNVRDAYANFYFGEFYYKRNDYKKALRYYNIAYNNGFGNRYDINCRLGSIHEKFADLLNAKRFYMVAYSMNPDSPELQERIQRIQGVNYEYSEYYRSAE